MVEFKYPNHMEQILFGEEIKTKQEKKRLITKIKKRVQKYLLLIYTPVVAGSEIVFVVGISIFFSLIFSSICFIIFFDFKRLHFFNFFVC